MGTILVVVHLFLAIGLVALILIQHGKGADAGAAFGSGASATVFGARGSANFLSRTTGFLALAFFVTSLALAWSAMQTARDAGLMTEETVAVPAETEVPLVDKSDVPAMPAEQKAESDVPVVPAETAVETTVDAAADQPATE